jgi:membrane protein
MAPVQTDWTQKPIFGVMIALALTLYGASAARRERRLSAIERAGNGSVGRHADEPSQIPAAGWWDILKRLFANLGRDNISLMAAGVAFYAMLSLTPGFTALVSLYGLAFDTGQVQAQVASFEGMIPEEGRKLITEQLTAIVQGNQSKLGIGLIVSLLIALWSANSGTSAMMSALNVAYAEREKRSMPAYYAYAMMLTVSLVVFGILSILLVAVTPAIIGLLPLGDFGKTLVEWVRWPILAVLSTTGLAAIYRYAPSRTEPRWSWVSWGAVVATLLWILGSALFSLYVARVTSYDKTYGSLGAVVVLLMWFYVSAYAVLLGAELNAEMEHQTARDTTDAPRKPMGWRGAFVADTVAKRA